MKIIRALERQVYGEVIVPAAQSQVWQAWTNEEGARSFFAPCCKIDLRPGGAYEMLFDMEAEVGKQGGEGMFMLALQPESMLSFTWNAPPEIPNIREQMTHVIVRLEAIGAKETRVSLSHSGWGEGKEWDMAFAYFEVAWLKVVLPRLVYRFRVGPIDWENPPRFNR